MEELNESFLNFNKTWRAELLKSFPVVMVLIDDQILVFRFGTLHSIHNLKLYQYHQIKSVVHYLIPKIVFAKQLERDPPMDDLTVSVVEGKQLAYKILDKQFEALIESNKDLFEFEGVTTHTQLLDILKGNIIDYISVFQLLMKKCAEIYLAELHISIQYEKKVSTTDNWNRLIVGVCGPKSPRQDHSAMQYFERLVGISPQKFQRKVYYLENVNSTQQALDIIAQMELERAIYDNIIPMKTDILAYDSKKYLEVVCKK